MRIRQWQHTQRHSWIEAIVLLFVILGSLPAQLAIIPLFNDFLLDDNGIRSSILEKSEASVAVPRLMGIETHFSDSRFTSNNDTNPISPRNPLTPKLAVGQQTGTGGGNVAINDSLLLIADTSMNTQNTISGGKPNSQTDTFTDTSLTDFTRNDLGFQLQSVTAEEDWREIESNYTDDANRNTRDYTDPVVSAAQQFSVSEPYANITQGRIYQWYEDKIDGDFKMPTGNISIFTDASGEPGAMLGTTTIENPYVGFEGIILGPLWRTYTFPNPIKVTQGTYWLVLNDTTNDGAVGGWGWYTRLDSVSGNYGSWAYKDTHTGNWYVNGPPAGDSDLICAIRILPTDASSNKLTYTNPSTISMTYNTSFGGYSLTSFTFQANNTDTHDFYTNTSVSFTLQDTGAFEYDSNPISGVITYRVQNSSVPQWNLTFSTAKVNTNELIRNRTIWIEGIEADWEGAKIFWNDSVTPEYADLTNDVNITWDGNPTHKYTHGNTTMVGNASTLAENVTWHVWFNATNYISSFSLERDSTTLSLPLKTNITDIIDLVYQVGESGGNASYWIEYNPTSVQVTSNTSIGYSGVTVTDSWDINNTVNQTRNVNGTYDLQAFWINDAKTKVGTYTRKIDVFINTSLMVIADKEVVVGQLFNVTTYYKSIHNYSDVNGALIWCNSSWTDNVTMNQLPDSSYNVSLNTTEQAIGTTEEVTITTQMGWFVNWTIIVSIKFIGDSSLTVNETNIVLEWRENTTIRIYYNDTLGNPIGGAMVSVDGNNTYSVSDVYYYKLNTTDYAGVGFYPNRPINSSHIDYVSQKITFNLTITPGNTSIIGRGEEKDLVNITGGLSKAY
ncbi:MAG: hypothetical protein ACW99Q_18570, partial [Candidatus Kariarchaeaceae archaeon]